MKKTKVISAILVCVMVPAITGATSSVSAATSVKYSSCAKLTKKHKHGIASTRSKKGKTKAVVNSKLYRQNKQLDLNSNGIACDADDVELSLSWSPIELSGTGSSVQAIDIPSGRPAIAKITHAGSSNFAVWALDNDLEQIDLLVNEIGEYSGTVFISRGYSFSPTTIKNLEIDADGAWTVRVAPMSEAPVFAGSATGQGDAVLRYGGGRTAVTLTHDGDSNYSVTTFNSKGFYGDLVANEIGEFSGKVVLPSSSYIVISADGNWTISK